MWFCKLLLLLLLLLFHSILQLRNIFFSMHFFLKTEDKSTHKYFTRLIFLFWFHFSLKFSWDFFRTRFHFKLFWLRSKPTTKTNRWTGQKQRDGEALPQRLPKPTIFSDWKRWSRTQCNAARTKRCSAATSFSPAQNFEATALSFTRTRMRPS